MIVDRILDRKDFEQDGIMDYYNPRQFYYDMMEYGGHGTEIARAMDYGTEEDVRKELCKYIDDCKYSPEIKDYINSVKWLESCNITLTATCSCCGNTAEYVLDDEETEVYIEYQSLGRQMGTIQNLFPRVPAWIRSGAIDKYSNGFCICPKCCGEEV